MNRRRRITTCIGAMLTLLLVGQVGLGAAASATEAESATEADQAGRRRYVEYRASATDRNGWRSNVAGEVLFYNNLRRFKIFGDMTTALGTTGDDDSYIAVRQNINRTTQNGRWYGICYDTYPTPNVPCDRWLDYERSSGSGASRVYYYWIGSNDSGAYFAFPTRPGRGLRGVWIKVCHSVDGPDNCGATVYADNPYVPGLTP
jgi:hypothetical protein